MCYVNSSDVEAYAGLGSGTIDASIVTAAEAFFDSLVGYNLEKKARSETITITDGYRRSMGDGFSNTFDLQAQIDETATISINGTALATGEYYADGRRLYCKYDQEVPDFPPRFKVEYTGGYDPVPEDVKSAIILITLSLNASKTAQGISSFKQDLLSVSYDTNNSLEKVIADPNSLSAVSQVIGKYRNLTLAC